jgi:hypothetical protein
MRNLNLEIIWRTTNQHLFSHIESLCTKLQASVTLALSHNSGLLRGLLHFLLREPNCDIPQLWTVTSFYQTQKPNRWNVTSNCCWMVTVYNSNEHVTDVSCLNIQGTDSRTMWLVTLDLQTHMVWYITVTKLMLHTILYWCETWPFTLMEEHRLRVLRTVCLNTI